MADQFSVAMTRSFTTQHSRREAFRFIGTVAGSAVASAIGLPRNVVAQQSFTSADPPDFPEAAVIRTIERNLTEARCHHLDKNLNNSTPDRPIQQKSDKTTGRASSQGINKGLYDSASLDRAQKLARRASSAATSCSSEARVL